MKKKDISYEKMKRKTSVPIYKNVEYACVGMEDITFYITFSSFYLRKSSFSGPSLQEDHGLEQMWNKEMQGPLTSSPN